MKIINLKYPEVKDHQMPETVCAVGYFDGIHLGHQKVIHEAINIANEKGYKSAVMTFHPHPSVVLKRQKQHVRYITPLDDKAALIEEMGVDYLFVVTFDETLADLLPQQFVDSFFIENNVKHVVAGFDFTYGRMGKGSMETMPFHSRGLFEQTVITKIADDEQKISSTIIRFLLKEGNLDKAKKFLGRPYLIKGKVVEGDKRGRTIGFPTANLEMTDDYLFPKVGVYAVRVLVNQKWYNGMANVGFKPTFHDQSKKPTIEVYIFDYKGDLYGQELTVEWLSYIRDEKKFSGIDELIDQLKADEQNIRSFFTG